MAQEPRPRAKPSSALVKGTSSHRTFPASPKWAARRQVLGAASLAKRTRRACRARQAAPTGSSPISRRLSLAGQAEQMEDGIIGHLGAPPSSGPPVRPTLHLAAGRRRRVPGPGSFWLWPGRRGRDTGRPPSGQLALKIQRDLPLGGADHPDQLLLGFISRQPTH